MGMSFKGLQAGGLLRHGDGGPQTAVRSPTEWFTGSAAAAPAHAHAAHAARSVGDPHLPRLAGDPHLPMSNAAMNPFAGQY